MPSEDRDDAAEPPITAEQIRQRAYDLWERNHRPEGFEMQFWLLAERELRAERARREKGSRKAAGGPAPNAAAPSAVGARDPDGQTRS